MKTWALVRYDRKDNELNLAGTYLFPETARNMAHGYGARGAWLESDGHALVVADEMLYDKKATWYLCAVEVMPAYSWRAALEAARYLRGILWGIARRRAGR